MFTLFWINNSILLLISSGSKSASTSLAFGPYSILPFLLLISVTALIFLFHLLSLFSGLHLDLLLVNILVSLF